MRILREGTFRGGEIAGDCGLNAVPIGRDDYWSGQARWRGALMEFEWRGPIEVGIAKDNLSANKLYDQFPHRMFIPAVTTKHLLLVGISLKPGYTWNECVDQLPWPTGLDILKPREWYQAWQSRTAAGAAAQIEAISEKVARLTLDPVPVAVLPGIYD